MLQVSSVDLWDKIEQELINLKNDKTLDGILTQKFESLINHFNGSMAKGKQFTVVESIRILTNVLNQPGFYKIRNMSKEDIAKLEKVKEDLSLLDKILVQESRVYEEEGSIVKDRFPNINNDKVLNLFKKEKK